MNIIDTLTARVEEYRATNKNPCKNYATKEAAEKATAKMAKDCAIYFSGSDIMDENKVEPAHYLVVFIPAWGRWVGFINQTEVLRRPNSVGGYMGFCAGFFVW